LRDGGGQHGGEHHDGDQDGELGAVDDPGGVAVGAEMVPKVSPMDISRVVKVACAVT